MAPPAAERLQNTLGAFQDCSTQAATYRRYAQEMQARGDDTTATLMAMGVVVERLNESKAAHRRAFDRRFRTFARRVGHVPLESGPPEEATIRK